MLEVRRWDTFGKSQGLGEGQEMLLGVSNALWLGLGGPYMGDPFVVITRLCTFLCVLHINKFKTKRKEKKADEAA